MINGWRLEWTKGSGTNEVRRYHKHVKKGPSSIQFAKYRAADAFDRAMGTKYKWHNKWYVNLWSPDKVVLFTTRSAALKYLNNYMKKH